jgi:hypothetical protein
MSGQSEKCVSVVIGETSNGPTVGRRIALNFFKLVALVSAGIRRGNDRPGNSVPFFDQRLLDGEIS